MGWKRNWRDPKDYGFTKKLTSEGWAWEFLRRNPEYRKDWERELKIYVQKQRENPTEKLSVDDPWFGITPVEDSSLRWGLYVLANPDQDTPYLLFKRLFGRITLSKRFEFFMGTPIEDIENCKPEAIPDGKASVMFDLRIPIKPQIEKARKALLRIQQELKDKRIIKIINPRLRRSQWPDDLRVFDAKTEGSIKDKEIAREIFPDTTNIYPDYYGNIKVRDYYNAANRLINGGYLKIAMS